MIAEKDSNRTIQSTMTGEKIAMGIDQSAMQHIMSIMTDLYSNPPRAVIREYSTNAYDAHVEAGRGDRAVEVTTPTNLAPFFTVKDFGVGLTVDDIHSIYSQYGASTKRATNEQVGMLGLGCKSALTYTPQFTLTSVKDGTRVTVAISRDEDGAGHMTIVDTASTDGADGTEIIVPVRREDIHRFIAEAEDFFSVWAPGTVKLNGEEPQRFEGLQIADGLYIVGKHEHRVVMGNVAYPVTDHFSSDLGYGHGVLAFVDIGAVNFTPAREALMYTSRTKATLADIERKLDENLQGAVQREIDKASNPSDAVSRMLQWNAVVPHQHRQAKYTFKGLDLPRMLKHPTDGGQFVVTPASGYRKGASYRHEVIPANDLPTTLWVEGYQLSSFTATHKNKLLTYVANEELTRVTQFVLTDKLPSGPWIADDRKAKWDDVNAIKLASRARSNSSSSGRPKGSYDLFEAGNFKTGVPAGDIDTKKPLFWCEGNRYVAANYLQIIQRFHPDATIVPLGQNRVAKFQRDFPTAKEAYEGCKELRDAWLAKLTKDDRIALTLHDHGKRIGYLGIDPEKVDDPDLKRLRILSTRKVDDLVEARTLFQRSLGFGEAVIDADYTDPMIRYPLFNVYALRDNPDHMYMYLNAAYAAYTKEA